jgi:hypothetical protein
MEKHLLANAHIAKVNELTESEVTELTGSMVDVSAVGILKRQGSRGITMVSVQRKIRFDILFDWYWLKWQTKHFKLAGKVLETSEVHQDMWNGYLTLRFVSTHIPWNALSNLALHRSYEAISHHLVLPSAATLSNSCWREYILTVDAIKKQLPSRNKIFLPLDRLTFTNIVGMMLGIACYLNRNWVWREVQLTLDEVDHLFFSVSKSN